MPKQLTGWAVEIKRADGSTFLAHGHDGNVAPTWAKPYRAYAVKFCTDLWVRDFDARVVAVNYSHPTKVVRKAKTQKLRKA